MHKLYELKDKLIQELEDYSENGKYSKEDVEIIKYMSSAVDHLCNIIGDTNEYSMSMDGSYNYGGSYAEGGRGGSRMRTYGGSSYARRGGRRGGANQYGSYAMGGYSRAAEDTVAELHDIMNDVQDDRVRKEIHETIKKIEHM